MVIAMKGATMPKVPVLYTFIATFRSSTVVVENVHRIDTKVEADKDKLVLHSLRDEQYLSTTYILRGGAEKDLTSPSPLLFDVQELTDIRLELETEETGI
jgi:hypothetical protein